MRVDATSQVGAQLAFDLARYTALVSGAGLGQKRLEVSRDQPVKRSRLRSPPFVAQRRGLRGVPHGRALANGVPAMNLRCSWLWRLPKSRAGGGQLSGEGAAGRLDCGVVSAALRATLSTAVVDVRGAQLAASLEHCQDP